MYLTLAIYTSDGAQRDFAVPFRFIEADNVKVYQQAPDEFGHFLGPQVPVEYSWINDGIIRLTDSVPVGNRIIIRRETFADRPMADFQDGAILIEEDLDLATIQALFVAQEARENSAADLDNMTEYFGQVEKNVSEMRDETTEALGETTRLASEVAENLEEAKRQAVDAANSASSAESDRRDSQAAASEAKQWAVEAAEASNLDEHLKAPDPHSQYLLEVDAREEYAPKADYAALKHEHILAEITDAGTMAFVDDAPDDGKSYVRKDKAWAQDRAAFPLMVGQVTPYFGAVADKSGFEPNFLYADGRTVSRAQYPELFAAYGTIYGDGDGATTFTLPDLRGVFVRGLDEGRGLDPARLLGVLQGDAIRNITGTGHTPKRFGEVGGYFTGAFTPINGSISYNATGFDATGMKYEFDASLVVPTAHENRPVNMACHWFIVAQSPAVASSGDFMAAVHAVNSTAQAAAEAVRAELRTPQVLHIQERQPNGTQGGTFTAGAWRTRNLNTVIRNTMPGADFDNTEIALPAGLYEVQVIATSYAVFDNVLALMDSNDAVLLRSQNAMNLNTYAYPLPSILQGLIELSQPTTCRLAHRCATTRANDGFGRAASLGLPEVYSDILIKRIR